MDTTNLSTATAPSPGSAALAALVNGLVTPTTAQIARFQCAGTVGGEDPQLRFAPADPAPLAASLIARFEVSELAATNCFEVDAQGHPTLVAGLREAGAPVLVTRAPNNPAPLAVVSEGRPATMRPVIVDVFQDADTRRRIEAFCGVMIVAATVEETIAWRFLGLAAAPIGALARCPRSLQRQTAREWAGLECIAEPPCATRNPQTGSRTASSESFPQTEQTGGGGAGMRLNAVLVVPAWNPITLAKVTDGEACPIATQLLDIERSAPCDFGGIGIWRPTATTIAAVAANLRAGKRAKVEKLLCQSLASGVWLAEAEHPNLDKDSSGNLITAQRDLMSTRDSGTSADRQAAATKYFQLVEESFVNPLRDAGLASTDPIRRSLFEAAAETRRILSRISAVDFRELTGHGLADPRLKDHVELHCRLTGDLLKLVDALKEPNRARHWNTKFSR
jgi:hypothetical protein